jgi:hypothetical protein
MINFHVLKKFQDLALKSLTGEWVIIGGAVMHLLNIDERTTLDIDLARRSGDLDETVKLMKISEKLGFSPYAINQAGSFFLRQIPEWEKKLILCAESKSCRLYRPNGTLYLQLKMARMSESDLTDCLHMVKYCREHKETLDIALLKREIKKALVKASTELEAGRLQQLSQSLG